MDLRGVLVFKVCIIVHISGRSDLGLKMSKFHQISAELWPLILKFCFQALS